MVKRKERQKQIWADAEFKDRLEKMKAKAFLNGKKFDNLGELTKEMLKVPAFADVEKQIIELDKQITKSIGMKFDGSIR
jgi:hypothetical protein